MNLIPEIAQKLGVEIGEDFRIAGKKCIYRFTFTDLVCRCEHTDDWNSSTYLSDLLCGALVINKIPYMPKPGQTYWFIGEVRDSDKEFPFRSCIVLQAEWKDCFYDHMNYVLGNCFPTEKKAIIGKHEIVKKVLGKDG